MSINQSIFITVDAVVIAREKQDNYVLLIKRLNEPFKSQWAFPGGFVDDDEFVIKACQRELKEETGLDLQIEKFNFLNYYDSPNRDPRSRTITFAFVAEVNKRVGVKGNDDADEAKWFSLEDLPELAFDHFEIFEEVKAYLSGNGQ